MIITGLDLSLAATGIASASPTGPTFTVDTIRPPKGLVGMERLDWLAQTIGRILVTGLVVCEDIAFSRNMAGHSEVVMLHGFIRRGLWRVGRPPVLVASTTLKKFCTGRGNAEKDQISKEVFRRWGIDTADNNQSDAVVLAQMGRCLMGLMTPETVAQAEAVEVVRKANVEVLKVNATRKAGAA